MKAWLRSSFRRRIFITVLLVTMVPVLFSALMMQVQIRRSESALARQAKGQLAQMEETFDQLCQSYIRLSDTLCASTAVRSPLRAGNGRSRVLYQILFRETDAFRDCAVFSFFDREGQCLYTTGEAPPAVTLRPDWGVLYAAGQSDGLVFQRGGETGETVFQRGGEAAALWAARAVRSYDRRILGYLVITMTRSDFDRFFGGMYQASGNIILLDRTWRAVYHSRPSQEAVSVAALRRQLLDGEPLAGDSGEYNFYAARQELTGFSLILEQPRVFTATVVRAVYQTSLLMSGLCVLLCLWCSWRLSRRLARPVHELDEAMGEVEKGNLDVQLPEGREDELGRLAGSFNKMVREYRLNLERSVGREREMNEVRIRMLQAQLNPHFLYNTLDSMKWLGVTHQVPQVASLAADLATILRAGISGGEFITLEQELELLDRYVDIQSLRFEDRFTCEIDVGERFLGCLVPRLLLQPLVENAIIHGVADKDDGYIKVWAEEDEGALLLSVSDNGCGIPPDILDRLNSGEKIPGSHLGLFNVSTILRLHFGEEYGLSAGSEAGRGSCVSLRLPILRG